MITVEMGNVRVLERMRARIATAVVREISISALLWRMGDVQSRTYRLCQILHACV
jgi:hypothetical protein